MEHQAELGKPPFFGTALEYCRENQAVQKRLGSDWEDWIQEALTEILVEGKDVTIGYVINRAHCRRIDFFRRLNRTTIELLVEPTAPVTSRFEEQDTYEACLRRLPTDLRMTLKAYRHFGFDRSLACAKLEITPCLFWKRLQRIRKFLSRLKQEEID